MDEIWLYVAQPSIHQKASLLINLYLGNEATMAFIAIVGANGMIFRITDGCGGCENDPNVALNSD